VRRHGGDRWLLAEHLTSRADLHTAAARMCELMARAAERPAVGRRVLLPPTERARAGGLTAADWPDRAEEFHGLRQQAAGATTT
jgi:hypothetical protein